MPVSLETEARILRQRAELIESEIQERVDGLLRKLQDAVDDLNALGRGWRSLVDRIAEQADAFDFRGGRDVALPVAEMSLKAFRDVADLVHFAQAAGYRVERAADCVLSAHEMENIVRWIGTWPTHDPTKRNRARESNRTGEFVSADEMIALLGRTE
jgi:hypothetical protein